jgi:hypothetical protein
LAVKDIALFLKRENTAGDFTFILVSPTSKTLITFIFSSIATRESKKGILVRFLIE